MSTLALVAVVVVVSARASNSLTIWSELEKAILLGKEDKTIVVVVVFVIAAVVVAACVFELLLVHWTRYCCCDRPSLVTTWHLCPSTKSPCVLVRDLVFACVS